MEVKCTQVLLSMILGERPWVWVAVNHGEGVNVIKFRCAVTDMMKLESGMYK